MELLTRFNDDGKMLASMLARCLSKAFYQHESGNTAIPEPENYTPMLHTERYHAVDFSSEGGFETEVELIQDFLRFRTEDADQGIRVRFVMLKPLSHHTRILHGHHWQICPGLLCRRQCSQ